MSKLNILYILKAFYKSSIENTQTRLEMGKGHEKQLLNYLSCLSLSLTPLSLSLSISVSLNGSRIMRRKSRVRVLGRPAN